MCFLSSRNRRLTSDSISISISSALHSAIEPLHRDPSPPETAVAGRSKREWIRRRKRRRFLAVDLIFLQCFCVGFVCEKNYIGSNMGLNVFV
nr:hypothetical protein Iba_chr13bCG5990 [Ipomoea batatas]